MNDSGSSLNPGCFLKVKRLALVLNSEHIPFVQNGAGWAEGFARMLVLHASQLSCSLCFICSGPMD
jgi:hypothetical protein